MNYNNNNMNELLIEEIKQKALADNVPIMEDDGINYVKQFLKDTGIKSMLEIGTAVGYSSIVFASYVEDLKIVTLEIDETRHNIAKENIAKANLNDRIIPILTNAREFETDEKFDVLFLDGPKAHNQQLFERYTKNLNDNGIIIVDDVYFHGYVDHPELLQTRRLKPLVRKLTKFKEDMLANPNYDSQYLEIGDGVLICKKKEN